MSLRANKLSHFIHELKYVFYKRQVLKTSFCVIPNGFQKHYSSTKGSHGRELIRVDSFLNIKDKTKNSYLEMINIYKERGGVKRDHVEFIYSALKHMKEFGVHKDLEVYKSLIDIFPKGKMIPRNLFQSEFMHYPKDQQCAIDLLEQMEENVVIPDWSMQDQLMNVFGSRGHPLRRYWRMMYWMPRFKNASPWPLPEVLPRDPLELAKVAIQRISSIDPTTQIKVNQTTEVKNSLDDTWVVSGQSEIQRELMKLLPASSTLYVEGGYRIWLKDMSVTYFTLTTDPFREFQEDTDMDNVTSLVERKPVARKTVHEQPENVVLGVASSGTSTPDSMLSWVRILQSTIPEFQRLKVLFRISSRRFDDEPTQYLPKEEDV